MSNPSPAEPVPGVPHPDPVALLPIIESALEESPGRMRFDPRLEDLYEIETQRERSRHLVKVGFVGLVVYWSFLASDYHLAAALFNEALVVRLGIVTPVAFLVMLAIWRGLTAPWREAAETGLLVATGLSIVYLLAQGPIPRGEEYVSGLILLYGFAAVVVRLRFWHTVALTLTVSAAYLAASIATFGPLSPIMMHNVSVLLAGSFFMLVAGYSLERKYRRDYLYRLQDRIHRAELRESNRKLALLSSIDPLTRIANRRSLDEALCELVRTAHDEPFGIIMMDVDHFKRYNDCYGHAAGDECLRRVAGALQASLRRPDDLLCRFGGEEFVALLPGTALEISIAVADRMRRTVRDLGIPHERSDVATAVTISLGVAWVHRAQAPEAALADVDEALYRAKSAGRDRVCVHGMPEAGTPTAA